MTPIPSDNAPPTDRIWAGREVRRANQRLLTELLEGRSASWHELEEPARLVRRLLDLGFDSDADLLWGDEASASRAYRHLLRATRRTSVGSLELGRTAGSSTGAVVTDGDQLRGSACLIGPRLVLTSTEVLATADAAGDGRFVVVDEPGDNGNTRLAPSEFFYAHSGLGFAVVALATDIGDSEGVPFVRAEEPARVVVGERTTVVYADAPGERLLRPCTVLLRAGPFFQVRPGDEDSAQDERVSEHEAIESQRLRGAPVFDVRWQLAGVVHAVDGRVAEVVDAGEIARELEHVGAHYGEAVRRFLKPIAEPAMPVSRSSRQASAPEPVDLVLPLRLRISIVADPASAGVQTEASTPGALATPSPEPPGPLVELPTPAIDLDATDGADSVPRWTNEGALGRDGPEHFSRAQEQLDDPDQARLWYWSTRLLLEGRRKTRFRSLPGFAYVAAGFLDPHHESNTDGHFGLIAYTTHRATDFLRPRFLDPVEIDGWRFPVVVRPVSFQFQQPTGQPDGGWSSCWATTRTKTPTPIGPGILTAQHVYAGFARGQKVPLQDGSKGTLVDVAPAGIDAALVKTDEDAPATAEVIALNEYIAPTAPVTMQLRNRNLDSQVIDVNNTFKVVRSPELPLRVSLLHAGAPGDSGGLVTDAQGRAIGIYLGQVVNDLGMRFGLAQHIFQASEVMDGMELRC